MTERDATPTPPEGHIEETPEAGPLQPPAWRDQFADPILQPGQQHASATSPPPAEPIVESVLEPGQITPENLTRAAREFADASPEQRTAQAKQAAEQAAVQARHLADRMRPLAADAATVAARALNFGARGLAGLAGRLAERGDRDNPTKS